jgi:hypothetical protein
VTDAVEFDLGALEREATAKPFTVRLDADSVITLTDATEVDWKALVVAMTDPVSLFRLVVPAEDQSAFFAASIPAWKLRKLMEAYQAHFGLGTLGEAGALPR